VLYYLESGVDWWIYKSEEEESRSSWRLWISRRMVKKFLISRDTPGLFILFPFLH